MMFLFIRNRNSSSADDLRKIFILKENMSKNYVVPVSIKPVVWFPLPGCVALSAWLVMLNTCLWLLLPMIWHSTQWVQGSAWCLISTNWTIIDSAAAAATSIPVSHCLVSHYLHWVTSVRSCGELWARVSQLWWWSREVSSSPHCCSCCRTQCLVSSTSEMWSPGWWWWDLEMRWVWGARPTIITSGAPSSVLRRKPATLSGNMPRIT